MTRKCQKYFSRLLWYANELYSNRDSLLRIINCLKSLWISQQLKRENSSSWQAAIWRGIFSKLLLHRYSVHWYFIFMLPRSDGENVETEEEHEGRRRFSRQADIISCHAAQIISLVPFTPFISSPPFPFLRPLSCAARVLSSQRYIFTYARTHTHVYVCDVAYSYNFWVIWYKVDLCGTREVQSLFTLNAYCHAKWCQFKNLIHL